MLFIGGGGGVLGKILKIFTITPYSYLVIPPFPHKVTKLILHRLLIFGGVQNLEIRPLTSLILYRFTPLKLLPNLFPN